MASWSVVLSCLALLLSHEAGGVDEAYMTSTWRTTMEQDTVAHGLRGQFVEARVGQASMAVYMSKPMLRQRRPAVIVAHHAVGLYHRSFMREFADSLAEAGYVAFVPDLFHRVWSKDVVNGAGQPFEAMNIKAMLGSLDDTQILEDLGATLTLLARDREVDAKRVAVLGFCMGGRIAWLSAVEAATRDRVHAAVAYHGGNVFKSLGAGTQPPALQIAENLSCPVLGHFAEEDSNPSLDDMKKLQELAGERLEVKTYPSANHGFSCKDSSNYKEDAAERAWVETLRFLKQAMSVEDPVKEDDDEEL
eukprot:TRINITY_DN65076_c0_g1_i1.p1 TRINITY_DN65076_c0_g1~~TRINITY_DN65076_c0_g1_i1.p1  ORF type:complete len:331 (-),score=85.30 TRINITY_DN65076_c0_g1_i1:22-936(-)